MFVPAGSPIFFLREHRFAVRCRVVTLRQLLWTLLTLLFMLSTCLLDIFLYIFFINIGCATLYHLSMMYVTVYNMSFNSNCRILAAELNYRFTHSSTEYLSKVPTKATKVVSNKVVSRQHCSSFLARLLCCLTVFYGFTY